MTLSLTEFAARAQRLTYQLVKSYELCDRVCLTQHSVTAAQGYTLLTLPRAGTMTMNELSAAMGLASSTMTRMADHLVHKGLVYRQSDYEDRRVVRVGLTAQGQAVQRTLEQAQQELLTSALADVHEDERPAILRALEQVNASIEKALKACCAG